jgi:hypothetical protein
MRVWARVLGATVSAGLVAWSASASAECSADIDCGGDLTCRNGHCVVITAIPSPDPSPDRSSDAQPALPPLPASPTAPSQTPSQAPPGIVKLSAKRDDEKLAIDAYVSGDVPPAAPRPPVPSGTTGGIRLPLLSLSF